ncbi:hypothetical protein NCS55_00440400 [Fusarium keratoplasticum]|nr:hypothetical protein NCS55_00440400 [Fusarium keratoplasticum]
MYSENSYSCPEAISSFVCNGQSVVGYSACVSGLAGILLSFHAHETWQDTSMCDTNTEGDAAWLFMPMDDGEVMTEIWKAWRQTGTSGPYGPTTNPAESSCNAGDWMLFTYADDHCEGLGEVRPDGLQEPIMTAERDTIWLGFRHDDVWIEDACPYAAEMEFEPSDMEG